MNAPNTRRVGRHGWDLPELARICVIKRTDFDTLEPPASESDFYMFRRASITRQPPSDILTGGSPSYLEQWMLLPRLSIHSAKCLRRNGGQIIWATILLKGPIK